MKKALITGITGQDGSYLAELLIKKGYLVHGIKRRSSSLNSDRIDHIYQKPQTKKPNFILHYGDLTDSSNITSIINQINPDEIYNLGAQSHVGNSFEIPEYTSNVNALGTLRILEAIRNNHLEKKSKFYQASTSELFGINDGNPQDETTPFYPRSPYAVSKLFSYWITINYREAYNLYACNGILFNHESSRRGETFVSKKITTTLTKIIYGLEKVLYLGNLNALRDWGHARDYVEMQWLMLQQDKPEDYVIASGHQTSVKKFVEKSAHYLGIEIEWRGSGLEEIGIVASMDQRYDKQLKTGEIIVKIDQKYFRPTEVNSLLGNAKKAKDKLKWQPKISLDGLIQEMIDVDLKKAQNLKLIKSNYI